MRYMHPANYRSACSCQPTWEVASVAMHQTLANCQANWADSNSAFSDHVEALHQFFKLNIISENRENKCESVG